MSLHGGADRERAPPDAATATPAVRVENLTKTYGSDTGTVTAVDDVSFAVERGTAVGLLGPNGAGKTTTIKSLLGLVIPTTGTTEVAGVDVHAEPRAAYRHLGAMLEGARNTYWRLTVRENLRFFAALAGQKPGRVRERHDELLERFDLAEKADTAVRELSRGMQQKVSLASTLARDAEVVFLDEPTLGLDVESSRELREELRRLVEESGMTVVLSSHDMDTVEAVCDRAIIMRNGEVVADETVDALLGLFHTQTYAVRVAEELPERLRARLRTAFDADGFETTGDGERFRARVTGDEFYALTDTLREAEASVVEFGAAEPDLEDVFLRVTGRDGGDAE